MIAKQLGCECKDLNEMKKKDLLTYDKVVFGAGVYINKLNKIQKVLTLFKNKPITIFSCGGSINNLAYENEVMHKNLTEEQLKFHKYFYLPGGLDMNQITGIMKFFMNILKKMLEKKENKTEEDLGFLSAFTNPSDYVDEVHILPLIDFIKGI